MSLCVSDNFLCSEICFTGYWYSSFVFFSLGEVQGEACHKVCGIKLVPPALEAQSLNPWPTREFLIFVFFYVFIICLFLSLFTFWYFKFYWNTVDISVVVASSIQQRHLLLIVLGLPCCVRTTLWLRCTGFPLQWLLLWSSGSQARAQQLWHMGLVAPDTWDLPELGIDPLHWQADS